MDFEESSNKIPWFWAHCTDSQNPVSFKSSRFTDNVSIVFAWSPSLAIVPSLCRRCLSKQLQTFAYWLVPILAGSMLCWKCFCRQEPGKIFTNWWLVAKTEFYTLLLELWCQRVHEDWFFHVDAWSSTCHILLHSLFASICCFLCFETSEQFNSKNDNYLAIITEYLNV